MTIDVTAVITALLTLLGTVITAFVVPWLRCRTSAQDREELLGWVDLAVAAAQQVLYSAPGQERKKMVRAFLKTKGYDVDTDEVDQAIEAAVLRLHKELTQ